MHFLEVLFCVLQKSELGKEFIRWIQLLFTNPTSRVVNSNMLSDPFHLQRGTQKGCPLSPLVFDLALEPMVTAVRNKGDIKGIKSGDSGCI